MESNEIILTGIAHLPSAGDNSENWVLPTHCDQIPLRADFGNRVVGSARLEQSDDGAIHVRARWLLEHELADAWLRSHRVFALGISRPDEPDAQVVSVSIARENVDPRVQPYRVDWHARG